MEQSPRQTDVGVSHREETNLVQATESFGVVSYLRITWSVLTNAVNTHHGRRAMKPKG